MSAEKRVEGAERAGRRLGPEGGAQSTEQLHSCSRPLSRWWGGNASQTHFRQKFTRCRARRGAEPRG